MASAVSCVTRMPPVSSFAPFFVGSALLWTAVRKSSSVRAHSSSGVLLPWWYSLGCSRWSTTGAVPHSEASSKWAHPRKKYASATACAFTGVSGSTFSIMRLALYMMPYSPWYTPAIMPWSVSKVYSFRRSMSGLSPREPPPVQQSSESMFLT